MKTPDWRLAFVALVFAVASPVAARIADAPPERLEVALVTFGPGEIYWERFGHDAIELRDRLDGEAVMFNYGTFDFEQEHFFLNFIRGRMRYTMDAAYSRDDIAYYRAEGRSIRRQVLDFSPAEAAALRDALIENLKPANAAYDYDYFRDNCATRVRDMLDAALGGALQRTLEKVPSTRTYRSEVRRLMAGAPWLMLPMDLGLGPAADRPLTLWQAGFIPMTLADAVATIEIENASAAKIALDADDAMIAPSRLAAPAEAAPDWRLGFLASGLALGLALVGLAAMDRRPIARIALATLLTGFLILAGSAGLLMGLLWAFTLHEAAWANQNLLLFSPLALLLITASIGMRDRRFAPRRWQLVLAAIVLGAAAAALIGKAFVPRQDNLDWIAFALPAWGGVLVAFLIRNRRVPAS